VEVIIGYALKNAVTPEVFNIEEAKSQLGLAHIKRTFRAQLKLIFELTLAVH